MSTKAKTTKIDPLKNLRGEMRKRRELGLKPVSSLSLPAWADRHRRLSQSSGNFGGRWRTSRFEIARGPMLAVTERGVRTITVMSCTQLLKTSLLENIIGRFSHLEPCPMLLVQPKDGAVISFSKERLAPMARATPVLHSILGNDRMHGGQDTYDFKQFPGGFLALESAGSPTNLAMRAIRITLCDEIDKYMPTKEGDPVVLAEERTSTFPTNSLHVRTCSPTWEETSRIYKSYRESDQRRPYVACPHCGYEQTLDFFRHVQWQKSEEGEHFPYTAAIYCESCGAEWSEAQRLELMTTDGAIKWYQTRPFVCCDERQEPMKTRKWKWHKTNRVGYACCIHCGKQGVPNEHAGFHASKLYSPVITVPELASKWIIAKDDPETKQTFYNTQLGLPFHSEALANIETHELAKRREKFAADVPAGVLVLTAGLDVQPGSDVSIGRIECEVVGWGLGEESWSITYKVFNGNPGEPEIWNEVDAFLLSQFSCEHGGKMVIRAACIDTGGHNTQDVYNFARPRMPRNVWAIKGASDKSGQWSPVWPVPKLQKGKFRQTGYRPVILGVNAAKEYIRNKLLITNPGPGFMHFPAERAEAWFDQLTAERLQIEKKAGVTIRKWVPVSKGVANEALDCRVYAYGALCGLYAVRKLNLERLAAAMDNYRHPPLNVESPAPAPASAPTPARVVSPVVSRPRPQRVRRSSFMG